MQRYPSKDLTPKHFHPEKFKNCVNPSYRPDNDDWFNDFCSKIAPCYVPSESEICLRYNYTVFSTYVIMNNFNISELTITSRKSTASGLDNISPVILKHLPANALDSLLAIMNDTYTTQQIPPSIKSYP